MLPLNNCYVTSPYGIKRSDGKIHTGIDLISKSGDRKVKAIRSGIYRGTYWDAYGYGNYVVIENDDKIRTLYCHLKSVEPIPVGNRIKEGQILGIEGTTGNSTGVHLHLEIRENPYVKSYHKNIAEYLGIKNEKGYVILIEQEENELRFEKLKHVPEGEFHDVIKALIEKGIIKGTSIKPENIEDTIVDLSYDMARILVINYRAGIYENALK